MAIAEVKPVPVPEEDLSKPELYINRELSLLAFNRRVLELAQDTRMPLLERLRFLCISSSNLDEFFEVRVGVLKQQIAFNVSRAGPDGLTPLEQVRVISDQARRLVSSQYDLLNSTLLPALESEGVRFLRRSAWSKSQAKWVKSFFFDEVLPVLTPLGLDPAHPFPRVLNKSLNFIVALEGQDRFGRDSGLAIVAAPRSLPRLIRLPEKKKQGPDNFVFLSSVIHAHADELFPGMTITGSYQFRVTRNSDLFVSEEDIDDLLSALKGELPARHYGQAVRLEVTDNCPGSTSQFLLDEFHLSRQDLYTVNGPVNLNRLSHVIDMIERPDLLFTPFTPSVPAVFAGDANIFDVIRQGDQLLHHPYESFTPVVEFVRQAAKDPDVLAIKQTLYRTGSKSVLVDALVDAARARKEVTVVIELRARFDEEANIELADRLHDAGCQVVYGIVGYKTHAKMILVVRREAGKIVRYAHLGTGNYHAGTARAYTDWGYMTCDPEITEDVHNEFHQITGPGKISHQARLLTAPFRLHQCIMNFIEEEAVHAASGKGGRIIARMNSLVEPSVIQALYRASQQGVEIDLIVRGMCGLRPGIAGVSDNIRVRSVLGRFLEHSRVFYFANNGEPRLYCGSADWMQRNFFRRVEVCFPVEEERLRKRMMEESLLGYLRDNNGSWELQSDGTYRRLSADTGERFSVQQHLLASMTR